jgi:hypothetical protein
MSLNIWISVNVDITSDVLIETYIDISRYYLILLVLKN